MFDLDAIRNKTTRFVVGLMSGTSCDGVDAALVRIKGTGPTMVIKLVEFKSFPFPPPFKLRLMSPRVNADELCALDFEMGARMGSAAEEMVKSAREHVVEVDFIATAGHTMAHLPPRSGERGGTLQIGEPALIAERCGLPVVSHFRQRDMAVGGQGAPLVPYADWILFHREDRTAACLNIGGIANVTVVPPTIDQVIAFDTGPGNMALDGAIRLLTAGDLQFDKDGETAAKGVVIDEFLDYLLDHRYFALAPPKSTGREEFGPEVYLRDALASRRDHPFEDLMATVTTAVAYSIVRAINRFVKPQHTISRLIVSGGGARNKTLIDRIRQGLPGIKVRLSDEYGMPAETREALAFAILGNETICGSPANVPSATGARKRVVLGRITPA